MRWCLPVFAVVFVMVGSGCQRPCDSSNCNGCCASEFDCLEGTSRLECGVGGEVCVRCTSAERCAKAKCEALPVMDAGVVDAGPVVCNCRTSCCLPDGTCAPNNSVEACGPVHAFCGLCRRDQRCELGVCVDGDCGGCLDPLGLCRSGVDDQACGSDGGVCVGCGTNQGCQSGACVFTRCDMSTCRFGCCQPDKACVASSAMACGLGGDPCAVCTGTQQCLGGFCQ